MTLEPTESVTRAELDTDVELIRQTLDEATTAPDHVRSAPHRCSTHRIKEAALDDPARCAMTWRAYRREHPDADA